LARNQISALIAPTSFMAVASIPKTFTLGIRDKHLGGGACAWMLSRM